MKEQSNRLPSLDGLRAVSILLVIVSHLVYTKNFVLPSRVPPEWLESLGGLGVRVFFVISGYLITSLLLKELETEKTIHLPKFYLRRTLRIFPPFYFFIVVVVLLNWTGWTKTTASDILHALTYTTNYYPEHSWDIGHSWSLSVEEQFYLLWPATLLLVGKRRGLGLALAFFFFAAFARLGYYYLVPMFVRYQIGYRFETAADAVAIGCLLAGARPWLRQNPLYRRVLNSRLMILVPFLVLYAAESDPVLRRYLLIGVPVQNIGVALCVAWCVANCSGRVGGVLNSSPLVYLGKMSYSLYLWQQIFTNPFRPTVISTFPLNILLIGVASLISFYLIERPALSSRLWLDKKLFGRTTRSPDISEEALPETGYVEAG